MKEFMFFIRKESHPQQTLSPERHLEFLKKCEKYIAELKQEGRLRSAQPIERQGKIISSKGGTLIDSPFNETNEVIGGYYHILAKNLEEAIAIAGKNPEFEYNAGTRIEVRPIKMSETDTGYVYPTK